MSWMKYSPQRLSKHDVLLIKSAQMWLLLGQPGEALGELRKLTPAAQDTPWAKVVLQRATQEYSSNETLEFLCPQSQEASMA
jgi:hypothetical protein